jgi:hypothetical protein
MDLSRGLGDVYKRQILIIRLLTNAEWVLTRQTERIASSRLLVSKLLGGLLCVKTA